MLSQGALRTIKLLQNCSESVHRSLEEMCASEEYETNDKIVEIGDAGDHIYFIIDGSVNRSVYDQSEHLVSYGPLCRDDHFGELSALLSEPREAVVIATSHCKLARINAKNFSEAIHRSPELSLALLQSMAKRVREGRSLASRLSRLTTRQRFSIQLLSLATKNPADNTKLRIFPAPSQQQFAQQIGAKRETVGRIIREFKRRNLVTQVSNALVIENKEALQKMIGGEPEYRPRKR